MELSLSITFETYDLVGNETIGYRQREACHIERGVDIAFALVMIGSTQQSELLIIKHQTGFDGMGVFLFLQIYELSADVTNGRTFVGHIPHSHVGSHGDVAVLIL